ncbi:MAG: hypothetical protein ACKODX_01490, partial [Gemmata sp.]
MADTRQRTTWGNRFRFLARAVGLTGLAAVVTGAALAVVALPPVNLNAWDGWRALPATLGAAANGAHGGLARAAALALVGGAAAGALALAVEAPGLLAGASGRAADGTSATVGVAAAGALL